MYDPQIQQLEDMINTAHAIPTLIDYRASVHETQLALKVKIGTIDNKIHDLKYFNKKAGYAYKKLDRITLNDMDDIIESNNDAVIEANKLKAEITATLEEFNRLATLIDERIEYIRAHRPVQLQLELGV